MPPRASEVEQLASYSSLWQRFLSIADYTFIPCYMRNDQCRYFSITVRDVCALFKIQANGEVVSCC